MPKKSVQRLQVSTGRALQVQVHHHPPSRARKARRRLVEALAWTWKRLMVFGDDDLFSIVWSLVTVAMVGGFAFMAFGSLLWIMLHQIFSALGWPFPPPPPIFNAK